MQSLLATRHSGEQKRSNPLNSPLELLLRGAGCPHHRHSGCGSLVEFFTSISCRAERSSVVGMFER